MDKNFILGYIFLYRSAVRHVLGFLRNIVRKSIFKVNKTLRISDLSALTPTFHSRLILTRPRSEIDISVVCSETVDRYTHRKFRALGFLLRVIFVRYRNGTLHLN